MGQGDHGIQQFDWRLLVGDHLGGTCLDLAAKSGVRAHLLAEHCDRVIAAGRNVSSTRRSAEHHDYASTERVESLVCSPNSLPFGENVFDTIVATDPSCATWLGEEDFEAKLEQLRELLAEDGSIVIHVYGWPREAGLARFWDDSYYESGRSLGSRLRSVSSAIASRFQSEIRSIGFDTVEVYARIPSWQSAEYTFDITNEEAISRILRSEKETPLYRALNPLVRVAQQVGILKKCYPHYLIVCSNGDAQFTESELVEPTLVEHGRSRAALMYTKGGDLERVAKVPNRKRHEAITERETEVLRSIKQTSEEPIRKYLPDGHVQNTSFGAARIEDAAPGRRLLNLVSRDVEQFSEVLETGLRWIAAFQQACGRTENKRNTEQLRRDLSYPERNIGPPTYGRSVSLPTTPVHGDCHPGNFLIVDDEIDTVIDWEYSVKEGNPLVDPSFFVLQAGNVAFEDLWAAFERLFLGDGPHAAVVQEVVTQYCERMDVEPATFLHCLPSGVIHQLRVDDEIGTATSFPNKAEKRARWVNHVWDNADQIRSAWEERSPQPIID